MLEHEAGRGAKYTKGRGPFELVYHEICNGRGQASKREIEIKSLSRERKLRLALGNGPKGNKSLGNSGTLRADTIKRVDHDD